MSAAQNTPIVSGNSTPAVNPQQFQEFLKKRLPSIKQAAASHLNPERLLRIVVANVLKTPALKACTFDSIFRCMMQSAELGLEPGSAIGDAYLVPYGKECQLIPGYRGLIKLAYRSGFVASVMAACVYQGDKFEFELGLDPKLRHVPDMSGKQTPDMITYAYCVVHLKDGGFLYDVMTIAQIEAVRAKSKAGRSGPWVDHYAEMCRKTVVRRCLKYAPMSVELQKAVAVDIAADTGEFVDAEFESFDASTIETTEPDAKTKALAEKLGGDSEQGALGEE